MGKPYEPVAESGAPTTAQDVIAGALEARPSSILPITLLSFLL